MEKNELKLISSYNLPCDLAFLIEASEKKKKKKP